MRRGICLAVLLGACFVTPASAQYERSGTTAGGPGAYGRPGELMPGERVYGASRGPSRPYRRRPGELAAGERPYGLGAPPARPYKRRPGEVWR